MKYINEILAVIVSLMLIIGSLCVLPTLAKVIICMGAILYGLENLVKIFKRLYEKSKI